MPKLIYILLLFMLINEQVLSQANVDTKQVIDNLIIYQDNNVKTTYYYVPYGLKLVTDKNGKPDFKFIQMRYTGTRLTDDQGTNSYKSLLAFKVSNNNPTKQKIDSIKNEISTKGVQIKELKPIAISNLSAELIYAQKNSTDSITLKNDTGFFESVNNKVTNTNWKERDYILRLNNTDAQIFWEGFENNQPTISVNYTYKANMYNPKNEYFLASGTTDLSEEMEEKYANNDSIPKNTISEMVINSGALAIEIDTNKWPELIKQIDINELTPVDYPVLDVYCYDFNNNLNENMYAKRIEIKATNINDSESVFKYTFKKSQPDIYAKNIKFNYAIKLDKPYQYRITKIYMDGTYAKTDWEINTNWNKILDITAK